MKTLWIAATLILTALSRIGTASPQIKPFESDLEPAPRGRIDELCFARWKECDIQPARLCSNEVFVRRVHLDLIGTLPTLQETTLFLQDPDPNKRSALIDRLLEREEFADYWAMKWAERLRVKAEFPINLWPNAVQAYHRWIRACIKENMPYDRFARELLTASGSCFRVPQVNFYRAVQSKKPQGLAKVVALTFMGERAERWPEERLDNLAAFFSRLGYKSTSEWKEEIVFFDTEKPLEGPGVFPDGTLSHLTPDQDPREAFADWLTAPDNPCFARNIVNRIWCWLLGRGIIHEPDDIRPDNPPANPELLSFLEHELVAADFNLKAIYRLILDSTTYQLSSIPRSPDPLAEANFAFYPLRRLEAEVLIDALCQITGTTEEYQSAIPEPFTFVPEEERSITLADGSITSSFLEMFGRPPRDTGLESERNNEPTSDQRLHLLNSSHIQNKIEQSPKLKALLTATRRPRQAVTRLYLLILSRYPTADELRAVQSYLESGEATRRECALDLVWALINSPEFLYRH
ncbi:MAG: DUF1553 domain-containing protein [Planctomycetota bacterium]